SADEESSTNFEAGVRYGNSKLSFESIYFVNDYDNLVGTVTDSTGGGGAIGDQFDGGEVVVQGLELSAGYALSLGAVDLPLALRYTWTTEAQFENGFESDFDPWGDVEPGDELPYIPENQLRVTAGISARQFRANIAANYIGKMRTVAGQGAVDPAAAIDAHTVWDFTASWRFTDDFAAYVKVDNLFDETYIAARRPAGARPGLPRTGYIGVTYGL
ncbi:MAG: TonB-dependent receptor domain-containing protein, partial [Woeseiaceae bacterium]